MICKDCGWHGDIHELEPQVEDDYGNELCPECGSMDVVDEEENNKLTSVLLSPGLVAGS